MGVGNGSDAKLLNSGNGPETYAGAKGYSALGVAAVPGTMTFTVDVEHSETQQDLPLTVSNTGTGELAVANPVLSGVDAAKFTVITPLPVFVPASGTADITVRYTPGVLVRTLGMTATLDLDTDDGALPAPSVALTGDAVPVELSGFTIE
jgi:hypothetical protein